MTQTEFFTEQIRKILYSHEGELLDNKTIYNIEMTVYEWLLKNTKTPPEEIRQLVQEKRIKTMEERFLGQDNG